MSLVAALLVLVCGCAKIATVEHREEVLYAPERQPESSQDANHSLRDKTWTASLAGCSIYDNYDEAKWRGREPKPLGPVKLSRSDVINVLVSDGDEFNGDYTIGPDGRITLPFMPPILAQGYTEQSLSEKIQKRLVEEDLFTQDAVRVSVRIILLSAISVRVSGAVFLPGLYVLNEPRGEKNVSEIVSTKSGSKKFGDGAVRRTLTSAIRIGSGARPDADLSRVKLVRRGRTETYDMRGALTGEFLDDPLLENGDEIHIPSRGCFQRELVRASPITPRGIRIYVSKKHFAADSRYDEQMPYGQRLLKAAVVASCIGGTYPTRGDREIVLVTRNYATGATEVVQRSVEVLLRHKDRDTINPFLMPDDGIACYDSPLTEAADVAALINTLLSPVSTVRDFGRSTSN